VFTDLIDMNGEDEREETIRLVLVGVAAREIGMVEKVKDCQKQVKEYKGRDLDEEIKWLLN